MEDGRGFDGMEWILSSAVLAMRAHSYLSPLFNTELALCARCYFYSLYVRIQLSPSVTAEPSAIAWLVRSVDMLSCFLKVLSYH